ncbi:MAG: hypothetical protein ACREQV_09760, partial [Candidatus Binatia bacterium]
MGRDFDAMAAFHLDKGNATAAALKITAGTTTGITASDGFDVGVDASGNAIVNQRENLTLSFNTNNVTRLTITADGNIAVGASDTTGALLILDTKTTAGDPTGVNGAMYYNSFLGTFRCFQNSGWINCAGDGGNGVNTIGTLDGQTKSANGAVVGGTTLYLQSADASFPGIVTTGTQTFAGAKTFTGNLAIQATSAIAFQVQDASSGNALTVDTTNDAVIIGNVAGGTAASVALYIGDTCNNFVQTCLKIAEHGGTDSDNLQLHGAAGLTFTTGYASEVNVMSVSATGAILLQNSADSTTAFRVQTTGATPVFTVDTTNGRVGIGAATANSALHIDKGTATASALKFTAGTTTGTTAADGFDIGVDNAGNAVINQRENLGLSFSTDNTTRLTINNAGRVGIGATSPNASLDVRTTAAIIGAIVQGAASQTANLLELRNSGGATLARFDPNGSLAINGNSSTVASEGFENVSFPPTGFSTSGDAN